MKQKMSDRGCALHGVIPFVRSFFLQVAYCITWIEPRPPNISIIVVSLTFEISLPFNAHLFSSRLNNVDTNVVVVLFFITVLAMFAITFQTIFFKF